MSQFISDPLSNVTNSNGAPGVPTTANFTTSGNITKINSTNSNDIVFDASDASVEITKDLVVDAPARFNQTVLAEDSLTVGSSNIFNASYNKGDSSIYTGSLNLNGDGTGYKYGVRGFNNSEIMTVDDSVGGRIGINEPNPLEKLHVNGNIRATSALLLGNPANLNSSYTGAEFPYTGVVRMNGDGTGYKYGIRGNGEQEVFTVVDNNDGRVGIGQTSPTEKLDVNGNVASLGLILGAAPLSDAFIQMRNVNGNNNFIQARNDDNLYITPHGSTVSIGQIGVSKQLSMNGGNSLGYIGSNFPVVGEGMQLAYNYDIVNDTVFRSDGTTSRMSLEYGNVRFFNSNNVSGAVPSTQTMIIDNLGQVGIGTNPLHKLDVNGNMASLGLILDSSLSSDAFIQMRNVNGNNNFIQARNDDNLYITPHGSTVSIGQIGVSKQLSMNGGNSLGYIGSNFPVVGEGMQLAYNYDIVNDTVFRSDGTTSRMSLEYGNVRFFNSNNVLGVAPSTQTMIIDNLGQVGIGTNPQEKLDVDGNINVSGSIKTDSIIFDEPTQQGSKSIIVNSTPQTETRFSAGEIELFRNSSPTKLSLRQDDGSVKLGGFLLGESDTNGGILTLGISDSQNEVSILKLQRDANANNTPTAAVTGNIVVSNDIPNASSTLTQRSLSMGIFESSRISSVENSLGDTSTVLSTNGTDMLNLRNNQGVLTSHLLNSNVAITSNPSFVPLEKLHVDGNAIVTGQLETDSLVALGSISAQNIFLEQNLSATQGTVTAQNLQVLQNASIDGNVTSSGDVSAQLLNAPKVSSGRLVSQNNTLSLEVLDGLLEAQGMSILSLGFNQFRGTLGGSMNLKNIKNGVDPGNAEILQKVTTNFESNVVNSGINSTFFENGSMFNRNTGEVRYFLGRQDQFDDLTVNANGSVGINRLVLTGETERLIVNGVVRVSNGNLNVDQDVTILKGTVTVSSDARIKKNIKDVEDNLALSQLQSIKPRTYEYIDNRNRTTERVYGFIAQELKEVLPYAVQIRKDFIPNIFKECSIVDHLLNIPDHDLKDGDLLKVSQVGENNSTTVRVQVVDDDHVEILAHLAEESKPMNALKYHDWENEKELFVYGKQIDDFHGIKKDYVYTLNVAATQEVARKQEHMEHETMNQKMDIHHLFEKINEMQMKMDSMQQEINELKNNNPN